MDKFIGMLGLCKNAGQLIMGFDSVCDSVKMGNATLVLIATDVSARTRKEINYILKDTDIPLLETLLTLDEIDFYVGKRAGVLCTEDINFAKAIIPLSQNRV